MSEKIGGAKGTELDEDFVEMERKIDVTGKLIEELMARTHELLQPNPASRAKLSAVNSISKIRGTAKHNLYPQPEGQLGECMVKYGKEMGEESNFGELYGGALVDAGEAYKQMADIKYALEDNVKQNFIEPLHHMQSKDLKEVNHHRKKLSGRRLDFDCKKRKQTKGEAAEVHHHRGGYSEPNRASVSDEEIRMAEEKFEESKQLAETAMHNLLENDFQVEQISQLGSFIEAQLDYHRQAVDILASTLESIQEKATAAANRPKREYVPKRVPSTSRFDHSPSTPYKDNNFDLADTAGYSLSPAPATFQQNARNGSSNQPCVEALYDFEPENEGELGFKEGDIINLESRIDENWFQGSVNGQSGYFPVNYVKVVVDLP